MTSQRDSIRLYSVDEMYLNDNCKGWSITKKINALENLTLAEKCVLQKLDYWYTQKGFCIDSNLKIALFYGLSVQYVSNIIGGLIRKGYVKNRGNGRRKLVVQNLPTVPEYAYTDSSWVDKDIALIDCLSLKAKFLLGEISNKSKNGRYFAGNGYLSRKFRVSTVQISRLIRKLRDKEFITATYRKSLSDKLAKSTTLRSIIITPRNRRNIELSQVDNLAEV